MHPRLPVAVPAGCDRDCAFLRAHPFAVEGQVVLARQAVGRRQRPPAKALLVAACGAAFFQAVTASGDQHRLHVVSSKQSQIIRADLIRQ